MVIIDSVITVFISAIGGGDFWYGIFALLFVFSTASIFYKVSTN